MPNFLLERLKKRSEFVTAAKAGDKWVAPGFILQSYRHGRQDQLRYGITASRKVGGAVERNRAKRRFRVLAQQILSQSGRGGTDYVLIARKESLKRSFSLMSQELEYALDRLHKRS